MGRRKCILCGVSSEKTEATFHRFPSDKKKQEEWCTILNIDINDLPLHAFICTNHFHKSDLIEGKRTQLKHSAVPSVEPLRQTEILNTFIEAKGDNEEDNLEENDSDGEPPRKRY
ncbi:unnamed protein product [Acanthoscelides obtectus]|uniref:THAP-type domain-containing protein n=1 Tax=Acanthoscelides obtectus TaxID=200917 RepID=A0A9P0M2V8_ACAOB|nr:unnamed protein product [Acanthoscelides obtectus]CAK1622538.1 THAP domain-containing protein 3 [Acanthoscelides obtectus]